VSTYFRTRQFFCSGTLGTLGTLPGFLRTSTMPTMSYHFFILTVLTVLTVSHPKRSIRSIRSYIFLFCTFCTICTFALQSANSANSAMSFYYFFSNAVFCFLFYGAPKKSCFAKKMHVFWGERRQWSHLPFSEAVWLLRSICRSNRAPVAKNASVSCSYIFLVIFSHYRY